MSEGPGKKDDEFDLSPELEGYISLDEARVLALQHARDNREVYGRYAKAELVFEVVDAGEIEDFHEVTLSYLPRGNFLAPGTERITISKAGPIELRQVLSQPVPVRRTGVLIASAAVVVVAVVAVVVVIATGGGNDSDVMPVQSVAPVQETPPPVGASGTVPASGNLSLETASGSIKAYLLQGAAPSGSVLSVEPVVLESLPSFPEGLSATKHAFDVSLVSENGYKAHY